MEDDNLSHGRAEPDCDVFHPRGLPDFDEAMLETIIDVAIVRIHCRDLFRPNISPLAERVIRDKVKNEKKSYRQKKKWAEDYGKYM